MSTSTSRVALAAIIAVVAIYGITNGFVGPLVSLRLEADRVDSFVIGIAAAASALGTLIVSPVAPRMMARVGILPTIVAALVLDALLIVALKLFDDLTAWLVIRVAMGASVACLYIASETWISAVADNATRGRVMAVYNAILSLSFGAGPLIIVLTGTTGWAPFLAAVAIIAAAALPLPLASRHVPELEDNDDTGMLGVVREAPTLVSGVALVAFLFSVCWGLLPVYGVRLGFSDDAAAALLTAVAVGGVVLQYPIGWLSDRYDRYVVMFSCGVLSSLSALLIPWSAGSQWLLWVLLFFLGGTFVSVYTVAMAIGGERFRGVRLAMLMAAFGVMWGVGSLIGPVVGGWAMALSDPHGLIATLVAAPLLWLAFGLVRQRQRRRAANERRP